MNNKVTFLMPNSKCRQCLDELEASNTCSVCELPVLDTNHYKRHAECQMVWDKHRNRIYSRLRYWHGRLSDEQLEQVHVDANADASVEVGKDTEWQVVAYLRRIHEHHLEVLDELPDGYREVYEQDEQDEQDKQWLRREARRRYPDD